MRVALDRPNTFLNYIEVLKPRETSLLIFIGACAAVIASGGYFTAGVFALTVIAIGLGSAGCNGLTNYLDREVDARMTRTCSRVLPSKRIYPPRKVFPLIIGLIVAALLLAWILHPLCFVYGMVGVAASAIWRKTITCTFFGMVAGCSPVLIGWFALNPVFDMRILLICLLVAIWIPIHVWSVMISKREEYLGAGLSFFPLSWPVKNVVSLLFGLTVILYLVAILLYVFGNFGLVYLVMANVLSIAMISATARLIFSTTSLNSWRVYKLSSFPYLGVIFLAMCLDILLV